MALVLFIIPLAVVAVVLLVFALNKHKTKYSFVNTETGEKVPGPSFLPSLLNLVSFEGNLWLDMNSKQKIYGDVWRTWFLGRPTLNVADPELVRKVLKDYKKYPKLVQNLEKVPLLMKFFGKTSLASVNHPQWGPQRALMNPSFRNNGQFFPLMDRKVNQCMDKWAEAKGEPIYVAEDLKHMTLDVLGESVLGTDFNTLGGENENPLVSYRYLIQNIFHLPIMVIPGYQYLPTPTNRKLAAEIDKFDKFLEQIIAEKKKEKKETPENLLDFLIAANQHPEEGNVMTDQMVRDNILLFFIAGHETTAVSLMFVVHQLAAHPEIQKRAREELLSVFEEGVITYEGILKLKYIPAIIKEVMRLYPPAPIIGFREIEAEGGVQLGPYHLPKGTLVTPMVYALHTNPKYWKNPMVFNPDRW
eukprot:CAMPEP_0174257954 /NCGR_PEP_ID=MMETSP0439-20130205/7043_1 /TAXON_ID=0 /ORGANISM="Stereomyxa ramosa, Strain Chinc5" /LENGTH=415 /DNA_ID=CAMNT_0015341273 /DNA_START=169 /DNA_END=1413 /DNA_ORIENTATION=-